ncbi:NUDIX domain-containing protein [Sandarakinorhabdus oryzae]|uniref:NUDIX domain-containing protein n=1 Tax=Sandarakinorhabdus oryzae TaxID=2675220 RepID=UPI0012E1AE81|nr:NUDIX hydrolase [Sandarakinorhabdus oryzae]
MIQQWDGGDFAGAKLAALVDGHILTYRRDHKPGIPWPGLIDLPGSGREGDESPAGCVLRELHEEFGLRLPESRLWWARPFPSLHPPGGTGWFLAAHIARAEVASIRFGDEGHSPQLLAVGEFLAASDAIAPLQQRLKLVLDRA